MTPTGGDEVSARTQIRELQWRTDGSGRQLIGVYDDAIERGEDGTLRFARRSFEMLYRGPADLTGRLHLADASATDGDPCSRSLQAGSLHHPPAS